MTRSSPAAPSGTEPAAPAWQRLTAEEACARLLSDPQAGLDEDEARRRLAASGPNELAARRGPGAWALLARQLASVTVGLLLAAAAVSLALGDLLDAAAIGVIVVLNAIIGFRQEYRAERAMAALQRLSVPVVRLRRGGRTLERSAREVVPGDVVLLEAGNLVPADGRILESAGLRVQEAALTGESGAIDKVAAPLEGPEPPLAERRNMAYAGTAVVHGRGRLLVTATGMATELGQVASLLQRVDETQTPLQARLEQLGRRLALAALALVAVVFALGVLRGEAFRTVFLSAVSLAVAAVPEGLPVVVTIALSLGAQRMLGRGALMRRLAAVETLGSVTVICSDKTGTLTENRMTVSVLDVAGNRLELREDDEAPPETLGEAPSALALLLAGGALCNDAQLEPAGEAGAPQVIGDPTEGALLLAAARLAGWSKAALEQALPRLRELPFDAARKRMTTLHRRAGPLPPALGALADAPLVAFAKGAPDSLLEVSAQVWDEGRLEPLDARWRERILQANAALAQRGMRVLAVAVKALADEAVPLEEGPLEEGLVFVGLVGMTDPVRAEATAAVATCVQAGIRPVMITGDHPLTARAVAEALGIGRGGAVLSGMDLERLSPAAFDEAVRAASVFARVTPRHKLEIVAALQRSGEIVAMTGDGVNDAPALKRADIGVAMGVTGTDVAKEAADMVLCDDNFATIVAAVEEGRIVYDNIRKFVRYILTGNVGELGVMLAAPLLGMPLPLLPLQILWINLVTDGLPALALGLEPAERGTMRRAPRPPREGIFAQGLGRGVFWAGLLLALLALALGFAYWRAGSPRWQTAIFTALTLAQMAAVLALRSERESLFRLGLLSNRPLLGAVLASCALQLALVYWPPLQRVFGTVALGGLEWALCLALAVLVFLALELEKALARRRVTVGQSALGAPRGRA